MEEKGGKVGAKWVQMSAADQEKGEKVQEKTGEVGGVRQKVGGFTDGRAKTPRRRERFL